MPTKDKQTHQAWIEVVRSKVARIRFGSAQIIVHDGHVTQVESLEKTRLPTGKESESSSSRAANE